MYHNFNDVMMAGARCLCLLLLVYGDTDGKLCSDTALFEQEYQLVKCCGNIISTDCDDERSLLVSVPEACDDQYSTTNSAATSRSHCEVIDLLLASVHSYHNYPLLVTGPAHNGTFTNISHSEKVSGFIIILGKGDEDTVFSVFKSELERLSHLPIWNARGKFIVISFTTKIPPVSFVPEEHKLIRRVLGELWEKDVVNCVVLDHNMDGNTSRETVDIHTWFPFTEDHCSGPADRTAILDQCVLNSEYQFVKNTKLFPDKMSNFHGCVMRASTFPHEPFVIPEKKIHSNVTQYSGGVEIRVLQTIASQLNFTVQYLPKIKSTHDIYSSLHDEVSTKNSDVGFSAVPISYKYSGKLEHTICYVQKTVKCFAPLPKPIPRWKGLVIIFTPLMWLLVLIVFLISSLIFWSLANVNRSVNEHVSYKNPVVCFLHTFCVVLGQAVFVRPHTWYLRLFFVVWVYYCLIINTAYQSSLISVLTQPQFESPVNTVEKFLNSHMQCCYTLPLKLWYSKGDDPTSKAIVKKGTVRPTLDDCLKSAINNQEFTVCGGELHILYLIYKKYSNSAGPLYIPFKDEVLSYFAPMFLRSGSPFLRSFNIIIYRVVESGMVQKFWLDINMEQNAQKKQEGHEDEDEDAEGGGSDAVVLTVDHLQGAFSLLVLGLACGLTVFIIELLCSTCRKYQIYHLVNRSVRELKARSLVRYKQHIIHKTYVRSVRKRT